jgi:N-acetylmuramoyl-L-alanine amidase
MNAVSKTPDSRDIDILARTIWGEARGGGYSGMAAVASVIMNRVNLDLNHDGKPDWWGEGVQGVCLKKWQFSCWLENDPNRAKLLAVNERDGLFRQALAIARKAVAGEMKDETKGATHYHAIYMTPKWAVGKRWCARIGRHLFYRLV